MLNLIGAWWFILLFYLFLRYIWDFSLKNLLALTMKPSYEKKGKKKPHCMKWHKIEPTSKQEEKHLKNVRISAWPLQFQGNDVIRDQSLGKINVKTSATVRGRWQEKRTFGVRLPGFKSITPTYSWFWASDLNFLSSLFLPTNWDLHPEDLIGTVGGN